MKIQNFDFVTSKLLCPDCKSKLHVFCKPLKETNINLYCYECAKNNDMSKFFPELFNSFKNLKLVIGINKLKELCKIKGKLIVIDLHSIKVETLTILNKKENVFYMQFFPFAPYTRRSILNDGGMIHSSFDKNMLSMSEIYYYQDCE